MKTIKELAVNHDYYCSEGNYHSNECSTTHETWEDFYNEMGDADVDMNLCFRWDVTAKDDENEDSGYQMQVSIMQQRKGRYWPHTIETVTDEDVESIIKYLEKHHETIKQIWEPFK